jgi:microcystin degradation protein MlrC
VLSDPSDSAAGGATGDSNRILAERLRQQVKGTALVPMVDAPAALADGRGRRRCDDRRPIGLVPRPVMG